MSLRCVIYISLMLCSHWCILTPVVHLGTEVVLYTYLRGAFCVARFDKVGNAKASERGASNSAGLHAFFMSFRVNDVEPDIYNQLEDNVKWIIRIFLQNWRSCSEWKAPIAQKMAYC